MNSDLYISFLAVASVFIVIPGPNVWFIIATSVTDGRVRGLQIVAGTSTAMALQLLIATLGSAWLIGLLAESFIWFKWLGIAYLIAIGIQQISAALKQPGKQGTAVSRADNGFWGGFIVSLTNPKTILFFAAFLPQFVDTSLPVEFQMMILSVSFLVLAILFDSAYAILAARLGGMANHATGQRRLKLFSGAFLLSLGAALSATRQQ